MAKKGEKYYKSEAIALMNKHDIEYCVSNPIIETDPFTGERYKVQYIDIDAPEGYRFETELHCLVCYSWYDAYVRLSGYLDGGGLESCEDRKCGDTYLCWEGAE
jgi:hypothetical protein